MLNTFGHGCVYLLLNMGYILRHSEGHIIQGCKRSERRVLMLVSKFSPELLEHLMDLVFLITVIRDL